MKTERAGQCSANSRKVLRIYERCLRSCSQEASRLTKDIDGHRELSKWEVPIKCLYTDSMQKRVHFLLPPLAYKTAASVGLKWIGISWLQLIGPSASADFARADWASNCICSMTSWKAKKMLRAAHAQSEQHYKTSNNGNWKCLKPPQFNPWMWKTYFRMNFRCLQFSRKPTNDQQTSTLYVWSLLLHKSETTTNS